MLYAWLIPACMQVQADESHGGMLVMQCFAAVTIGTKQAACWSALPA